MKMNMYRLVRLLSIFVIVIAAATACSKKDAASNQPPQAFTVAVSGNTDKTALLTWTEAKDPENGSVSYSVSLNTQQVAAGLTATSYQLTNLTKNNSYTGKVTAKDDKGNETVASFSFTTTDAPTPTDFTLTADTLFNKKVAISWTASTLPNGDAVMYDVYANNALKQTNVTVLKTTVTGLTPNTDYSIKVVAKSADGKSLDKTITAKTKVNTAPAPFTISEISHGFSFIKISSGVAADADGDVVKYFFYRNGSILNLITTDAAAAFEYVAKPLASNTAYSIAVVAEDEFGARTSSNIITVTTNIAPSAAFYVRAIPGSSDVTVEWIADNQLQFDITKSEYQIEAVKRSLNAVPVTFTNLANNKMGVKIILPAAQFAIGALSELKFNLSYGADEIPLSTRSNYFPNFNYTASPAVVSDATLRIDPQSGTYEIIIHFVNDIIGNHNDWSIEQIQAGDAIRTGVQYQRAGNQVWWLRANLNQAGYTYLRDFNTGYIILKDADGYHKINFTYTVQ
jgi:hypothetical protein